MFLLFLLGLDLSPQRLLHMLHKATVITLGTSLVFALASGWIVWLFGYSLGESLLIGTAMTFSSTIIGLKLLPTRTLHHQHTGEIIISILLLQDMLAIAVLLLLEGLGGRGSSLQGLGLLIVTLPLLLGFAFLAARYVLIPLIDKFDKIREYIFLTAIGWCLCISEVAALAGLCYAIGAFIGGGALASSPISLYIADSLKPLRDFFLVLFFFSLGAGFDLGMLREAVSYTHLRQELAALYLRLLGVHCRLWLDLDFHRPLGFDPISLRPLVLRRRPPGVGVGAGYRMGAGLGRLAQRRRLHRLGAVTAFGGRCV